MMNALLELIEWFIEPVYRFLSPTRYNGKKTNIVQFPVTTSQTEQNSDYYQNLLDEELLPPENLDCKMLGHNLDQTQKIENFMGKLIELTNLSANIIGMSPLLFCKVARI